VRLVVDDSMMVFAHDVIGAIALPETIAADHRSFPKTPTASRQRVLVVSCWLRRVAL
jgi:hypothetical protein